LAIAVTTALFREKSEGVTCDAGWNTKQATVGGDECRWTARTLGTEVLTYHSGT